MNEKDTITFTKAEAAVLREALQFIDEMGDGLNSDEQPIFDKLDALFD
ncbi:hypothetical protein [Stenotrophomonas phage vB_SmeS_BUCT700]|uniref:Uncharacterized protein n=1 Tax=Stenotrophomonas phage vB_SmeS_BUCT700 TaxID=2924895 RepID=A0AAE9K675_9CAUD|nr:hypothetical protein [Stenotrophomonas phage vB_SmeS_BUCT700]UNY50310.1 hypothetical protein [Stenotrophomonas phage vB_SmeS_BUCT703]